MTSDLKWKNLDFDEHFHPDLAMHWFQYGADYFKVKKRIFGQLFVNQPFGKNYFVDFASNLFRNLNVILKWGGVENLFKHATSCLLYAIIYHSWMFSNNKFWLFTWSVVSDLESAENFEGWEWTVVYIWHQQRTFSKRALVSHARNLGRKRCHRGSLCSYSVCLTEFLSDRMA